LSKGGLQLLKDLLLLI